MSKPAGEVNFTYDRKAHVRQILKTAGEVRFIKDNRGDQQTGWAYQNEPVGKREITTKFNFVSERMEPLKNVLVHCGEALEHVTSAYNDFAKLKSVDISPDGYLGGKGYIQKIVDMRRQFMNMIEALSAMMDTIYDELDAEHWKKPPEGDRTEDDTNPSPQDSRMLKPKEDSAKDKNIKKKKKTKNPMEEKDENL